MDLHVPAAGRDHPHRKTGDLSLPGSIRMPVGCPGGGPCSRAADAQGDGGNGAAARGRRRPAAGAHRFARGPSRGAALRAAVLPLTARPVPQLSRPPFTAPRGAAGRGCLRNCLRSWLRSPPRSCSTSRLRSRPRKPGTPLEAAGHCGGQGVGSTPTTSLRAYGESLEARAKPYQPLGAGAGAREEQQKRRRQRRTVRTGGGARAQQRRNRTEKQRQGHNRRTERTADPTMTGWLAQRQTGHVPPGGGKQRDGESCNGLDRSAGERERACTATEAPAHR